MAHIRHLYSGKVRDIYELDKEQLLLVSSDRISAFDRVFSEPIPDKGRVLTAMTAYFSEELAHLAPTHLISADPTRIEAAIEPGVEDGDPTGIAGLAASGRALLVRRAEMLPIECIVRGYLAGSAWKEYQDHRTVHGVAMPDGLAEGSKLERPIFTPSTKSSAGHDENITVAAAAALVGASVVERAEEICLAAYARGVDRAGGQGIIVADTKFELGFIDGELAICDEILTPDSSRFWPEASWEPGHRQVSFDKQPVRDWVEATGWDKSSPPPAIPEEIVAATRQRYIDAYELLSGRSFDDWWGKGR